MEHAKALPWGAVWDELCRRDNVPAGADWLQDVARYEKQVLARRG
jgi:L-rhamnose isomerase